MIGDQINHAELAAEAVTIKEMRRAFNDGESIADITALAQVHATLALVEATERVAEQARIGNLIALGVAKMREFTMDEDQESTNVWLYDGGGVEGYFSAGDREALGL